MSQSAPTEKMPEKAPEENWYIVKQTSGQCEILSSDVLDDVESVQMETAKSSNEKWGPFKSQNQAIAKRVGLIRSGKCQPS